MYVFHFIDLPNPDFNCSKCLLSFSAYKVTTGTQNLQSIISNLALVGELIRFIGTAGCGLGSAPKALPTSTHSVY